MKIFELLTEQINEVYPNDVYHIQERDAYQNLIKLVILLIVSSALIALIHLTSGSFNNQSKIQLISGLFLFLALIFGLKSNHPKLLAWTVFIISYVHLPIKFYTQGTLLCSTPLWYVLAPLLTVYFIGELAGGVALITGWLQAFAICYLLKGSLNFFNTAIYNQFELIMLMSLFIVPLLSTLLMVSYSRSVKRWKFLLLKKFNDDFYLAQYRSLGQMAGNMAHEINNPLAIIKGNSDFLIKKLGETSYDLEKELQKVKAISFSSDRIGKIVKTLLQISKKEISKSMIEKTEFRDVFDIFYPLVEQKIYGREIDLKISLDTLEYSLDVVKESLAHVIYNLINNSISAVENIPNPYIEIKVFEDIDKDIIQIIDNGIGIDYENSHKIMEPFFTTHTDRQGAGLGLSLSSTIIETMSGTLDFSSETGHTVFSISLNKA